MALTWLSLAHIALGDLPKAREQLAWLERLKADEEAGELKEKIEAWAAAHPDTSGVKAAPDSTRAKAAPTDSTASPPAASKR